MIVQRAGPTWLSAFPFKVEFGRFEGKWAFVDIGGGIGTQALVIKESFPELKGKLMLQDMPEAVEHIPTFEGVEVMASNIFEPQVIKGMTHPPYKHPISAFRKLISLKARNSTTFETSSTDSPMTKPSASSRTLSPL